MLLSTVWVTASEHSNQSHQFASELKANMSTPPLANSSDHSTAAYWENRLRAVNGLEGVGSIAYGREFNEWMYRVRRHVFLKQIDHLNVPYSEVRVLDVGSGTGFWLDVWRSLGVGNLTGSDLTTIAVERLRAHFPSYPILKLDIAASDTPDLASGAFDVISAFDVLFHIVSDEAFASALANVNAMLKPGGLFLFSENLPREELARASTQVNRTIQNVTGGLSRTGFRILRRIPMFVLMNAPVDSWWKHALLVWKLFMKPVAMYPRLGSLYGAVLYPLEVFLVDRIAEGPSTELVICQKV